MQFKQSYQASQHQAQVQSQKLAMTQQLQQSIQILAYSNDELQEFISNKALENPFLEVNWHERNIEARSIQKFNADEVQQYIEQLPDVNISLYSYLEEQIYLNYRKTAIRDAMFELLNYLDDNGYLTIDLAELVTSERSQVLLEDALTLLQQLEPAGIFARNLQECLLLQIERDALAPELAYIIIEENFEDFATRNWQKIAETYQIELKDVQLISDYILTLTPHPGSLIGEAKAQSIIPELTLTNEAGRLHLTLNKYGRPTIKFEVDYFNDIMQTSDDEALAFAKAKKNEVVWLTKSLEQRTDTILMVGTAIIEHQKEFFLDQTKPLKPLTMAMLAKELKLHESTISRAVNGKYLETWFGILELKSLLAKKAANSTDDTSTEGVKKALQKIINNENKQKPLSDQKLVDLLKDEGYHISRRTIAKYREELNIPSSSKRKRYI